MVIKHKRVRNFRTRPSNAKTVIIRDKLDVFRLRNYSFTTNGEKNDYSFIIERVYEDRYVMDFEGYSARKDLNFDFNTTQSSSWSLDKSEEVNLKNWNSSDAVLPVSLQEDTRGFLHYLLSKCDHTRVLEWSEFLTLGACKKLGEGVYGEVFQLSLDGVQTAVKIIPFMDKECFHDGLVNGEHMKQSMKILPELLITKELSQLADQNGKDDAPVYSTPSFVQLIKTAVVRGDYPEMLLSQWDKFSKVKQSENDRPDKYSSPNQLFMVFALSLGGKELECYTVKNEKQAFSIFLQVAWSLAVAEETLEFRAP